MTRLSLELKKHYPRKYIWWMECDRCEITRSSPEWSVANLPLDRFADQGWHTGKIGDVCPACLAAGHVPTDEPARRTDG